MNDFMIALLEDRFGIAMCTSEVISKSSDASKGTGAFRWISEGTGEYEVEPYEDEHLRGTKIILHLKAPL